MLVPMLLLQCSNRLHCSLFLRDLFMLRTGLFASKSVAFFLDRPPSFLDGHPTWLSSVLGWHSNTHTPQKSQEDTEHSMLKRKQNN
jgi:hypothetical protein